jgi:hypothetical protein
MHDVHKYTPPEHQPSRTNGARAHTRSGSLGPERLAVIGRLLRVGCPIDHAALLRYYPLRIYTGAPGDTKLFPLTNGGTGIFISIRIVAVSRVTFNHFELRRPDNTPIPVRWAEYCDTHSGYCIHDRERGCKAERSLSDDLELFIRAMQKKFMAYGDDFEGYLVGESSESLADARHFLLAFIDKFESEYLFPISLPAN